MAPEMTREASGSAQSQVEAEAQVRADAPLVSIVTPVYGAAGFIRETLAMVCGQTFGDWEWILVDDASPDGSGDMIEAWRAKHAAEDAGRIRLVRLPENGGAAAARNEGIRRARGRYLAFLDADDVWTPDKLARELAFIREKDAAFVCHSYEFGDENARGTGKVVHVPARLTYREALTRTVIFTTTVMIDLTKLEKDEVMMPLCASEDTATWWNILRGGTDCFGLDEVLAVYRRPGRSLSSNKGKAIVRIWNLYRSREHLSVPRALCCMAGWAVRAALRRL